MAEDKTILILEKIESLEKGQQKNYDLIHKNGLMIEQLGSDIKAVAEGHQVIRNEMNKGFGEVKEQIRFVDTKVEHLGSEFRKMKEDLKEVKETAGKIEQKLDEHMRQPAHA